MNVSGLEVVICSPPHSGSSMPGSWQAQRFQDLSEKVAVGKSPF